MRLFLSLQCLALLLPLGSATIPKAVVALVDRYEEKHGKVPPHKILEAAREIIEPMRFTLKRDVDAFELCSGCGRLSSTLHLRFGLKKVISFDNETRTPDEDLCNLLGLVWAAIVMLRLRPKGLFAAAPECKTWGHCCELYMCRNHHILGDDDRNDVWKANQFAEHMCWLLFEACMRGVFVLIEQPKGSYLWDLPSFAYLEFCFGWHSLLTYMGAFGHQMPKATWLRTNFPLGVVRIH